MRSSFRWACFTNHLTPLARGRRRPVRAGRRQGGGGDDRGRGRHRTAHRAAQLGQRGRRHVRRRRPVQDERGQIDGLQEALLQRADDAARVPRRQHVEQRRARHGAGSAGEAFSPLVDFLE